MNNEQKAEMYNQLMYEYTKTQNQISSIKGEAIDLNERQLKSVSELESKLNNLYGALESNNVPVIRTLLKELVPGYQPEGDVVDWVWMENEKAIASTTAGTIHD